VDANGEPMVVFHGTSVDFDEFKKEKIGKRDGGFFGRGFYFTDTKVIADDAASFSKLTAGGKEKIMGVFLNIRNPLSYTVSQKDYLPKNISKRLIKEGIHFEDSSTYDLMIQTVMSNVIIIKKKSWGIKKDRRNGLEKSFLLLKCRN
jgi:hypothetical protein